jgi:hypothetical protein
MGDPSCSAFKTDGDIVDLGIGGQAVNLVTALSFTNPALFKLALYHLVSG